MMRVKCHCKISTLYVECMTMVAAEGEQKDMLSSCKNQCPKELPCGHRCKEICHPGDCSGNCNQKVKLRCPCKRIKKELLCNKVREGQAALDCDQVCKEMKRNASEMKAAEEKAALEEEKRRQQAELEAFENRMRGRRKKNRRKDEIEVEPSIWQKSRNYILVPLCVVAFAMATFYIIHSV